MENKNMAECSIETKMYTVQEIAKMLSISVRAAYNFCENNSMLDVKRIGKSIRVTKNSFHDWLSNAD